GVALELEQLPDLHGVFVAELAQEVGGGKGAARLRRAVEDDGDVLVAGAPGIPQAPGGFPFIERVHRIAQPVEGGAQRPAPFLIPAGPPTGVAAAVERPAADAVHTAP